MHISSLTPRRGRAIVLRLALVVILGFFAVACGGGARPTITTEALVEGAANGVPAAPPAQITAVVEAVPTQPPAAATATESAEANESTEPVAPSNGSVEQLTVEIVETYPHDPGAFTQGLELLDGLLIESTGQYGESDLRRTQVESGEVIKIVANRSDFFAEGLTRVGDQLIQLTWQSNTALYWDAETFELNSQVNYAGEGWGLCYDGQFLVMTDGSAELTLRDPVTFDEIARVPVTYEGRALDKLNELECVNGVIWANVWLSDQIVRIDPATGNITGLVDASSIRFQSDDADAVLNGIAWDANNGNFLITGKRWPTLYRVNFVPVAG